MNFNKMKKVRFCLEKETEDPGNAEHSVLRLVDHEELSKHTACDDCWIAIHGKIYNISGYLNKHPGGAQVMLRLAGKDGTAQFDEVGHSLESLMFDLGSEACVGLLNAAPRAAPEKSEKLRASEPSPILRNASTYQDRGTAKLQRQQLWKWQKIKPGFSSLTYPSATAASSLPNMGLSSFKENGEARKTANTIITAAVMTICITILLYVKLRCPDMIEHVVAFALPDEQASEDYEIPKWYL
ncbi:LAME_0A02058g1_1 [Lachancea meyersii CBS 8951]|uniref:LAME_0A02058g1_1 n=1 Tax=Lachancea meyersii CBS 8951 TaxID=1266667 RepID=A0A1G4IMF1_9SACH|nr:LAME_0A02058g1_1 [Lachancea meyersii CBS 8951]